MENILGTLELGYQLFVSLSHTLLYFVNFVNTALNLVNFLRFQSLYRSIFFFSLSFLLFKEFLFKSFLVILIALHLWSKIWGFERCPLALALAPLDNLSIMLVEVLHLLFGSVFLFNFLKLLFDFFEVWVVQDIIIVPVSTVLYNVTVEPELTFQELVLQDHVLDEVHV